LTNPPSKNAILQARLAVVLIAGLLALGAVWYGVSFENLSRLWRDLLDRPGVADAIAQRGDERHRRLKYETEGHRSPRPIQEVAPRWAGQPASS
jgi:hypothetical protein